MLESYTAIAKKVWQMHRSIDRKPCYTDILAMNAMARLGKADRDSAMIEEIRKILKPYVEGRIPEVSGAYGPTVYRFGGNATAFMVVRDFMPEAKETLLKSAEMLCTQQPRGENGLFEMPVKPEYGPNGHNYIWIDTVFCVCPFLIWAGKALERPDFIEECVRQMLGHHRLLFDPEMKLYRQAFNARGNGCLTHAHWSRGEGWGLLALSEILYDLPKDHPAYPELLQAYRDNMEGCAASQDANGMWHQAMESLESYPESSGTALILYAISRGLKNGSIADADHDRFLAIYLKGLRALLGYVGLDGSVYNACKGCCNPGKYGTVEDYANHAWVRNDHHGTSSVLMCLSQAEMLCFRKKMIPGPEELLK